MERSVMKIKVERLVIFGVDMKRENIEIRDQVHLMDAEGCHDNEPNTDDIRAHLEAEGFHARTIEVWFDDLQKLWRWRCGISRI